MKKQEAVQTKSRMRFTVHPRFDNNTTPWRGQKPSQWGISRQDDHLLALRDWYPAVDAENLRVVCREHVDAPLEKTRLYGPYDNDSVRWLIAMAREGMRVVFGRTYDGKEYVEF